MAQQTIYAGQEITAAFLNSIAPLNAVRSSTQSHTSNTTLSNDDTLFLALAANATYSIELLMLYSGGTLGSSDLKWAFTLPSGASGGGATDHITPGAVYATQATDLVTASNSANQCATNGAGVPQAATVTATLFTSSAGTLHLQWAQVSSSGTATIMAVGSSLLAWRLA